LSFVEAIPVEDLSDLVENDWTSFVNMHSDLEAVEVAGKDDYLSSPVAKLLVVELSVDCYSSKVGQIGKRIVFLDKFLFQVNILHIQYFSWFSTPNPLEIDNEEAAVKLSHYQSVSIWLIGVGKVGVSDVAAFVLRPVLCSL